MLVLAEKRVTETKLSKAASAAKQRSVAEDEQDEISEEEVLPPTL